MHSVKRVFFLFVFAAVTASAFWSYRVKAAEEKLEFAPTSIAPILLPAGTQIHAVLWNGLPDSTAAGDSVTAFANEPITVQGEHVIAGAQLRGKLTQVFMGEETVEATMKFRVLEICGRSFPIQTRQVMTVVPIQTEIDIAGSVLQALMRATVGAGIGAQSGDRRVVGRGMLEGARASVSAPSAPITVILLHAVEVQRCSDGS